MDHSFTSAFPENGGSNEIRLKGHLDDRWNDWFDGLPSHPSSANRRN